MGSRFTEVGYRVKRTRVHRENGHKDLRTTTRLTFPFLVLLFPCDEWQFVTLYQPTQRSSCATVRRDCLGNMGMRAGDMYIIGKVKSTQKKNIIKKGSFRAHPPHLLLHHHLFIHSSIHPFIHSSIHPFIHSSIHPFISFRPQNAHLPSLYRHPHQFIFIRSH